jgi:hypothetical protein
MAQQACQAGRQAIHTEQGLCACKLAGYSGCFRLCCNRPCTLLGPFPAAITQRWPPYRQYMQRVLMCTQRAPFSLQLLPCSHLHLLKWRQSSCRGEFVLVTALLPHCSSRVAVQGPWHHHQHFCQLQLQCVAVLRPSCLPAAILVT